MIPSRYTSPRVFLAARFRPATRLGLALTVQVAVLVLLLSAFSVVTEDVVADNGLVATDGPIERFAAGLLAHRVRSSWRPLGFLAVTARGATLTSTVIKLAVARPRPVSGALVHALGYAFPSGHSTTAAATWLSSAVVVGSLVTSRALRVLAGLVASVVVVLVGFSRVSLGAHAPTDVLGGWALGALWVAGILAARSLLVRRQHTADA